MRSWGIGWIVLAACGRYGFGPTSGTGGDGASSDGAGASSDGTGASNDGALGDGGATGDAPADATTPLLSEGTVTGPLTSVGGCFGTYSGDRSLAGDLPPLTSQDQDYILARPAPVRISATDQVAGQPKLVVVTVTDPALVVHALQSDGTNKYGSVCLPTSTAGTYTVHITNNEASQQARSMLIKIETTEPSATVLCWIPTC